MVAMRDAMAAACRRAALVSLARASASYQPSSYNDAAALRVSLAAALDSEITAAGDAGEDATYTALKALRSAVVQDLTARGASLPSVVTVNLQLPLPSLVIAQRLYLDASRSDQIAAESGAIHPAFCPTTFQALASGTGLAVNPSYDLAAGGSIPLIAPAPSVGVYQLPSPNPPLNLAVASTTASTAVLSWSPATTGGLASGYTVQVGAHGAGIWSTAGTIGPSPTGFTVTGLSSNTAYDFQVLASNASGVGSPSILATATTALNPPNAPAGLAATAGSPAYSAVALSWTASASDGTHDAAAVYTVQYQVAPGGGWTTFGVPAAGTSVSVTGLAHATAYNFQVIASNSAGSATSSFASATTSAAAPNVPLGLEPGTLLAITASSFAITWSAAAIDGTHDAATSYTAQYRATSVGGAWTQVSGIGGTSTTITGLSPGTEYDFQVAAVNAAGASSFSATANGATYATTLTLNYISPGGPYAPGYGPGVNVTATPTPANVREAFGSSATVPPASGWINASNYSGNLWGGYPDEIATAGNSYLWIEALNAGGAVIGLLVAGPYTVT